MTNELVEVEQQTSLTPAETKALSVQEAIIDRGVKSFVDVGNALKEIRDRHLYTDVDGTFEGYCKTRWGFARACAYRYIEASITVSACAVKVLDVVSPIGDKLPLPGNEAQARPLGDIEDPKKRAEVWAKAVETAPKGADGKPKITAAHVANTVREETGQPAKKSETPKEKAAHAIGNLNKALKKLGADEKHSATLQAIAKDIRVTAPKTQTSKQTPSLPESDDSGFEQHEAQKPLAKMDELLTKIMSQLSAAEKILGKAELAPIHAGLDAAFKAMTKLRAKLKRAA